MSLSWKTFAITGGSSGIGAATSRLLAKKGAAAVCIADVTTKDFAAIQKSIAKVNPSTHVHCTEVDVTSPAGVNDWINDIIHTFGNLHGAANVAGIPQGTGMRKSPTILEESDDAWKRIFDVNLNGVFYCTKAQVRAMKDLPPANRSIVNIASIAAYQHLPDIYAYHVSKTACAKFSSSVAKDTFPFGVRVNSVLPGKHFDSD
jgi:chanoclavine-I dehydrogenase